MAGKLAQALGAVFQHLFPFNQAILCPLMFGAKQLIVLFEP